MAETPITGVSPSVRTAISPAVSPVVRAGNIARGAGNMLLGAAGVVGSGAITIANQMAGQDGGAVAGLAVRTVRRGWSQFAHPGFPLNISHVTVTIPVTQGQTLVAPNHHHQFRLRNMCRERLAYQLMASSRHPQYFVPPNMSAGFLDPDEEVAIPLGARSATGIQTGIRENMQIDVGLAGTEMDVNFYWRQNAALGSRDVGIFYKLSR